MFGDDGGREAVAAEQRERQYAAIAGCIRANKGAVCAEQLRPFLLESSRRTESDADTGASWLTPVAPWLLPVLHRFDGRPVATAHGDIVYTFPELLRTTSRNPSYGLYPKSAPLVRGARSVLRRLSGPSAERFDYLEEPLRSFTTYADAKTQRQVFIVACANLVAVVLFGALLGPLQLYLRSASRRAATLALVNAAYGGLLLNGLAWLLLPTARRVDVFLSNWAVRSGNRRRRRLAARVLAAEAPLTPLVSQDADPLVRGLRAARELRSLGRGNEVGREEVVYTTAKDVIEQAETQAPTRDAWDAKLRARGGAAQQRGAKRPFRRPSRRSGRPRLSALAMSAAASRGAHAPTTTAGPLASRVSQLLRGHDTPRLREFAARCVGAAETSADQLAEGQECAAPFPELRAAPWWPSEAFAWASELEAGAPVIADELRAFEHAAPEAPGPWETSVTSLCEDTGGFAKLVLAEDGEATALGAQHFARTLELLRRAGVPLTPRPVSLNRQEPGSGLPPHSDNLNFLLVCHVGVRVPRGCRFLMHGSGDGAPEAAVVSERSWGPNKLLVADTSFVHSTTNGSPESRYVLHFSVWHPDLTRAEREGIVRLHEALQAHGAEEPMAKRAAPTSS